MRKKSNLLYFGKKVLIFIVSVFVLSLAVFYISRLAPGDPLVFYLWRSSGKDESRGAGMGGRKTWFK